MDKARHKRNYDLHSWSGVTLGIFLFIVCFTGSIAVFALAETHVWEDPAKRIALPNEPAPITDTFDAWHAEQVKLGDIEFLGLNWPSATSPYYEAYADIHLHGTDEHVHLWAEQRWHPETLAPLETRQASMSEWLVDFHIYLKWPTMLGGADVGAFLVGLAGILLLLSVLTGVIAHTKLKEEAFSLRLDKSVRLKWQDSHKVIGLWGAPFHVMIGFTGAFLGIIATMTPVVAFLAFQGNTSALLAAVEGEHQPASGVSAQMMSFEDARMLTHLGSEQSAQSVRIEHYGDEAASYTLMWPPSERLAYDQLKVSAVTGEVLPLSPLEGTDTAFKRINAAVAPLHFGTFGGVAIKFVWFFLGLSLSVITALGTMMWIERRQHGNVGSKSDTFYTRLSKLNVGICTGLGVATAALFLHNVLYWGDEAGRGLSIAWAYLGVWIAAIAYAFIRTGIYKANRELIGLTGILLIAAAVLNQLLTELPTDGVGNHTPTLMVDVTLIIFGATALFIAKALPAQRTVKSRAGSQTREKALPQQKPVPAE